MSCLGANAQALHEVIAGTAVVYAWDARTARLRFLATGACGQRPCNRFARWKAC
ncbi:MAG: hypothetical protein ACM3ML_07625 [Micromonosporaceae bacterium]